MPAYRLVPDMKAAIRPRPLDNFVQLEPRIQSQQANRQVKTVVLRLAALVAVHSSICMTADHLTPLQKDCFKDSVTAAALSMGRTKCTSLITKVLGPTFKEMILSDMKACKYSLLLDESMDVSATGSQGYHAVFAAINSGDRPKKLVGLSGTRWLSIAGIIRTVLVQWVELKTHFEFAKITERCYTANVLSDMFNDDPNLLLLKFLSPIIDEFDRMNKVFQTENPDPSKLYSDLLSFVKYLMSRVVLPNHASPGSNWEAHIMHVTACDMGGGVSRISRNVHSL
ncbi:hypothetical protein HPB47_007741 [Ixodes persulcatus]|uniref:Uncharacterized protein n=1 Tax=Ixodes persulcatus TaxID=34615 RepID=A0AC60P6N0_IXOPE|nr:hypothetical protein HPB47_007741 [Ixodes persulcatus]